MSINQDKELLTMGANVFNLKPGIIMGYFQNKKTLKELEKYSTKVRVLGFYEASNFRSQ